MFEFFVHIDLLLKSMFMEADLAIKGSTTLIHKGSSKSAFHGQFVWLLVMHEFAFCPFRFNFVIYFKDFFISWFNSNMQLIRTSLITVPKDLSIIHALCIVHCTTLDSPFKSK